MEHQSENQYKEGEHFKRTRPQKFDPLNKDSKKTKRVGVSDTSTEVETTVCVITSRDTVTHDDRVCHHFV